MRRRTVPLSIAAALMTAMAAAIVPGCAVAASVEHLVAERQALDLAKKAIALRSVQGKGNQTPDVAALYAQALVTGGFARRDVTVTPVDDTAYLVARWPGSDSQLKPLVISGHMDVVAARPADWDRDPFVPLVENGYLFGRGVADMKLSSTLAIAALMDLKRQGYRPKRTIILEFSGDEESTMKTSAMIANQLKDAELVLNIDGAGGVLDEKTGAPKYFSWSGAEKTYADFKLTLTNPGGHSSEPRVRNAITDLSAALVRIGAYRFKPEVNDVTRAAMKGASAYAEPEIGAAMRAFATDPTDRAAIATLSANPSTVGKIGTTCVVTMIEGGHALNALPQRASANINCRIFPGHKPAEIMAELQRAAADAAIAFEDVTVGAVATDASPMRPDFIVAVEQAVHASYPGLPVFPAMSSGASDSMWFRHVGVPSYEAGPLFIKPSENFMHGLNERAPLSNLGPSITYFLTIIPALSL